MKDTPELRMATCKNCRGSIHEGYSGNMKTWFHVDGRTWCPGEVAPAARFAEPIEEGGVVDALQSLLRDTREAHSRDHLDAGAFEVCWHRSCRLVRVVNTAIREHNATRSSLYSYDPGLADHRTNVFEGALRQAAQALGERSCPSA